MESKITLYAHAITDIRWKQCNLLRKLASDIEKDIQCINRNVFLSRWTHSISDLTEEFVQLQDRFDEVPGILGLDCDEIQRHSQQQTNDAGGTGSFSFSIETTPRNSSGTNGLFRQLIGNFYQEMMTAPGGGQQQEDVQVPLDTDILMKINVYTAFARMVHSCVICQQQINVGEQYRVLPCNETHIFHQVCIDRWFSTSTKCPTCRSDIRELVQ